MRTDPDDFSRDRYPISCVGSVYVEGGAGGFPNSRRFGIVERKVRVVRLSRCLHRLESRLEGFCPVLLGFIAQDVPEEVHFDADVAKHRSVAVPPLHLVGDAHRAYVWRTVSKNPDECVVLGNFSECIVPVGWDDGLRIREGSNHDADDRRGSHRVSQQKEATIPCDSSLRGSECKLFAVDGVVCNQTSHPKLAGGGNLLVVMVTDLDYCVLDHGLLSSTWIEFDGLREQGLHKDFSWCKKGCVGYECQLGES